MAIRRGSGLERAGEYFVDLIGDFHAEREELVVELSRRRRS